MIEQTGTDTTTGDALLVELDEIAGTLRFIDALGTGETVREYATATFATVTGALAIDSGLGLTLSAQAVAELKQWARI